MNIRRGSESKSKRERAKGKINTKNRAFHHHVLYKSLNSIWSNTVYIIILCINIHCANIICLFCTMNVALLESPLSYLGTLLLFWLSSQQLTFLFLLVFYAAHLLPRGIDVKKNIWQNHWSSIVLDLFLN